MLRFIAQLLNIKYEPCKSCKILKEQLKIERQNNKDLLDQIILITKPELRQVLAEEDRKPVTSRRFVPWSEKQRQLEIRDKNQISAEIRRQNPQIIDEIDKLENELGVEDASEKSGTV